MSNKIKSKNRSKSGMLTGLMIVSTGLIAGFQGLDLAMSDNKDTYNNRSTADHPTAKPSQTADAKQSRSLEQLIKASHNQGQQKGDQKSLSQLVRSSKGLPTPATHAIDNGPTVNRALKRDRGQAIDSSYRDALDSIQQAAIDAKAAKLAEQAKSPAPVKAQIAKVSAKAVGPIADSADIALFAADMPLPDKLVFSGSRGKRMPSLPGRYARALNGSPLVPRTFRSGKAFGGLAEREFQKRERRCMTTALYFEARSEPESGQIAVGQVVMNRVRSPDYPDTICGVVYQGSSRRTGCQFSFTCDGKADKPNSKSHWERSKRLSNQVLEGQIWLKSIGHATHYHADYVAPRWRRKMHRLKKIGRHIFYKAPKVSVTETYQRYTSGKRS